MESLDFEKMLSQIEKLKNDPNGKKALQELEKKNPELFVDDGEVQTDTFVATAGSKDSYPIPTGKNTSPEKQKYIICVPSGERYEFTQEELEKSGLSYVDYVNQLTGQEYLSWNDIYGEYAWEEDGVEWSTPMNCQGASEKGTFDGYSVSINHSLGPYAKYNVTAPNGEKYEFTPDELEKSGLSLKEYIKKLAGDESTVSQDTETGNNNDPSKSLKDKLLALLQNFRIEHNTTLAEAEVKQAQKDYDKANKELTKAQKSYDSAQKAYETAQAKTAAKLEKYNKEKEKQEKLAQQVEEKNKEIEEVNNQIKSEGSTSELKKKLNSLKGELRKLKANYNKATSAMNSAKKAYDSAVKQENSKKTKLESAKATLEEKQANVDDKKAVLDEKKEALNSVGTTDNTEATVEIAQEGNVDFIANLDETQVYYKEAELFTGEKKF